MLGHGCGQLDESMPRVVVMTVVYSEQSGARRRGRLPLRHPRRSLSQTVGTPSSLLPTLAGSQLSKVSNSRRWCVVVFCCFIWAPISDGDTCRQIGSPTTKPKPYWTKFQSLRGSFGNIENAVHSDHWPIPASWCIHWLAAPAVLVFRGESSGDARSALNLAFKYCA